MLERSNGKDSDFAVAQLQIVGRNLVKWRGIVFVLDADDEAFGAEITEVGAELERAHGLESRCDENGIGSMCVDERIRTIGGRSPDDSSPRESKDAAELRLPVGIGFYDEYIADDFIRLKKGR